MKLHAFRLTRGMDLRNSIVNYCETHKIQSAAIVTVVGCLSHVCIRTADGVSIYQEEKNYEIVSFTGTKAENGVHFHIALSDSDLCTIGGHVKEGCIVNTTAEVVLLEIDEYHFVRELDEETGYDELKVV